MKIRSNYVSNSSSSSYIIQFEGYESNVIIAGEEFSIHDFFNYIDSCCSFNSETEMHEITYDDDDRNELIEYVDYQLQWAEDETKQKLIDLKKDIKNKDLQFARFDISNHDKAGNFLLKLLQKYGLFTIRNTTER